MKRFLVSLLVVLLLADMLAVAHAEATVGASPTIAMDQQSQGDESGGCPDGPRCTHACHLGSHFVGMVATSLDFAAPRGERSVAVPAASIFAVITQAPFRPPRLLA